MQRELARELIDPEDSKIGNEEEEIREKGITDSHPKGLMDNFMD